MVDSFVQGMKSLPSRINPQSLNPIAFNLLRDLRQTFLIEKRSGSWVAKKIISALKEAQKTQADKFLPIMVEMVTVVLLAARDSRIGLKPVFSYIVLGSIKAMKEMSFPVEKIERMTEQLLVAVFMTPAYDFKFMHFLQLTNLTKRLIGEVEGLHKIGYYTDDDYFRITKGLGGGFMNCLEIVEVNAAQKEELKTAYKRKYNSILGYADILFDWLWLREPAWLSSSKEKIKKLKEKITFKKRKS